MLVVIGDDFWDGVMLGSFVLTPELFCTSRDIGKRYGIYLEDDVCME